MGVGIELRDTKDDRKLYFEKSKTHVIRIGRKSVDDRSRDDRASYECPVVSKDHAKITLTEGGGVRSPSSFTRSIYSIWVEGLP